MGHRLANPLFISNSNSIMNPLNLMFSYFFKIKFDILLVILVLLLVGEIYMRFPFIPQRLEYQVDNNFVAVLKPNQIGFVWMSNMSMKSPVIELNSDGHRGKETNWSKPIILTVGNSQSFGGCVKEEEVWCFKLNSLINSNEQRHAFQVVNDSHPGFGPCHHYIRAKRVFEKHNVDVMIVRVDIADRNFKLFPKDKLVKALRKANLRSAIRKWTKFVPYLFNKIQAQIPSIKASFCPKFLKGDEQQNSHSGLPFSIGQIMWNEFHDCWENIADLADSHGSTLIFLLHDPIGLNANSVILQNIKDMIANYKHTYILHLNSKTFGLKTLDKNKIADEYRSRWTMVIDPHANSYQHQLIAFVVYRFLKERGIIESHI